MFHLKEMSNKQIYKSQRLFTWIENVIDSCNSNVVEQEKVCHNLIDNFFKQIKTSEETLQQCKMMEQILRKKLTNKFYKTKNK